MSPSGSCSWRSCSPCDATSARFRRSRRRGSSRSRPPRSTSRATSSTRCCWPPSRSGSSCPACSISNGASRSTSWQAPCPPRCCSPRRRPGSSRSRSCSSPSAVAQVYVRPARNPRAPREAIAVRATAPGGLDRWRRVPGDGSGRLGRARPGHRCGTSAGSPWSTSPARASCSSSSTCCCTRRSSRTSPRA